MDTAELNAASRAQAAVHGARPRRHPFLGGLLVKDRLINETQLDRVLALQQETEPRPLLGQLLVDQKLITPHELNTVLGKYRREHLLGDILVETNLLTPAQLEAALVGQRRTGVPLGETLIQLGYITERQLKNALSIQLRIAFVDLDRRSIDPELAAVISERYARRHRAIPIARDRRPDRPGHGRSDRRRRRRRGALVHRVPDRRGHGHRRHAGAGALPPLRGPRRARDRASADGRREREVREGGGGGDHPAGPRRRSRRERSDRTRCRPRSDGDRASSEVALDAVWSQMEAVGQRLRNWESRIDAVDSLLRERVEQRSRIERLTGDLRENRAALARRGRSSTRGSRPWRGSRSSTKPCYATGRPSRAP